MAAAGHDEQRLPCTFVRDLKMGVRRKLAGALDRPHGDRNWQALAAEMACYTAHEVMSFELEYRRAHGSPTLTLLEDWGRKNKTVDELVLLLKNIGNQEAVQIITDTSGASDGEPLPTQVEPAPHGRVDPRDIAPSDTRTVFEIMADNLRQSTGRGSSGREDHPPHMSLNGSGGPAAIDNAQPAIASADRQRYPPAQETLVDSPYWPPAPGAVRTAMLRAQHDAAKKAAVAVCDYEKLRGATNGFSSLPYTKGGNCLGSGGYGNVFYLEIARNGQRMQVACKRMHQANSDEGTVTQFINELVILTKIQSVAQRQQLSDMAIVELKGVAVNGSCPCLVYEFMSGGSLLRAIQGDSRLDRFRWQDRHKVAAQISKALNYLHMGAFGSPIIHGDVKSSNILLDSLFNAKLGDFGAAHIVPEEGAPEQLQPPTFAGTMVYMAPEARRGTVTTKSDAYSFGIVLFELLTGLKVYDKERAEGKEDLKTFMMEQITALDDLVDRAYHNMERRWPQPLYTSLYKVAMSCTENRTSRRTPIAKIVDELETLAKKC